MTDVDNSVASDISKTSEVENSGGLENLSSEGHETIQDLSGQNVQQISKPPKKRMGCFKFGCIGCLLWMFCMICFLSVIFILFLLNPPDMKKWLNGKYGNDIPQYEVYDMETRIVDMFDLDNSQIHVSEDEVYNFLNPELDEVVIDRIEFEDGRVVLMTNIAKEGDPLWLMIELGSKGERFVIYGIGFGAIKIPAGFLTPIIYNAEFENPETGEISKLEDMQEGWLDPALYTVKKDKLIIDVPEGTVFEEMEEQIRLYKESGVNPY